MCNYLFVLFVKGAITNMATKQKQGKSGKENEKRSAKRAEDNISVEDKKTDSPSVSENAVPDAVEEQPSELKSPTPKPPTPEPVYDEPVLTQLIVERYLIKNVIMQQITVCHNAIFLSSHVNFYHSKIKTSM